MRYACAAAMVKHGPSMSITSLAMVIEAVSPDEAKGKAYDLARQDKPDWVVASLSVVPDPIEYATPTDQVKDRKGGGA